LDRNFGYLKRNAEFLGLIRLAFECGKNKADFMLQRVGGTALPGKPKLLDQVRISRGRGATVCLSAYRDWIRHSIFFDA